MRRVRVPGDKSISHRAVLFGALAPRGGPVTHLADGADVRSSASVIASLGKVDVLDCGNSGTTMRLVMGIMAGMGLEGTLIGDASLSGRPMGRIAEPLERMGARIELSEGRPPVRVCRAPGRLRGIEYVSPVASAQVKSAILLAGLFCDSETTVIEPARSRDHTERMLAAMGADLEVDGLRVTIRPGPALSPLDAFAVPGDLSSAAFLLAAGSLIDGGGIVLEGVGVNPTRTGVLDALAAMGADLEVVNRRESMEPTADLVVRKAALSPLDLSGEGVVRAIDEVPILAVLATQAHGRSVIRDAAELRVKECDRLAVTAGFLNDMGARVTELDDGLVIEGPTPLRGASVDPHYDHRIAMAAAVAGLVADGDVRLEDESCIAVSYPGFFEDLETVAA